MDLVLGGVVVMDGGEVVDVEEENHVVTVDKTSVTAMLKQILVKHPMKVVRFLLAHHFFMLLGRLLLPSLDLWV